MSEIAVIGLGAMGAAITQAFWQAGHAVCVWNRSPKKAEPAIELGVKLASSLAEAFQMSPRVLIFVSDYIASISLLDQALAVAIGSRLVKADAKNCDFGGKNRP